MSFLYVEEYVIGCKEENRVRGLLFIHYYYKNNEMKLTIILRNIHKELINNYQTKPEITIF